MRSSRAATPHPPRRARQDEIAGMAISAMAAAEKAAIAYRCLVESGCLQTARLAWSEAMWRASKKGGAK